MKWPSEWIANSSKKSFGMYEQAVKMMARGIDVIHLEVGCPCFDTPAHIKEATKRALDAGKVHYGEFAGELHLREALAEKVRRFNRIDVAADEILITNGLTHASYAAFMAALDPGDEVILLEPYYPQHINKIELAGGRVVLAPLDRDNNFAIRPDWIEDRITPKTRMIVLVNPANPTGRVYTREELEGVAALAQKHDLLVVSDEVYEYIIFDEREHVSIASLPGMKERTITMCAFTKAYAMDGWRIGYAIADRALMPALLKITMNDVAHVNVFIQDGAYAAVTESQDCIAEMLAEDRSKRQLVVERLNQMPGVICPEPEGTIYAFPDIRGTGWTSQELADELLADSRVVTEAGSFYGALGEGFMRICFGAESYERIEEAMDRISARLNR